MTSLCAPAAQRRDIDPLELYASAIDTSDYVSRMAPQVRRLVPAIGRLMSLIAIELLDGELWSYVEERAERYQLFAAGTVYAKFVFQYTRSIHAETHGRPRDALLAARDAARTASTAQERLLALCRRATVLLRYGERLAYDDLALSIRERFHALEPQSVRNWEVTAVPLAVAEVLALMGDIAGASSAAEFAMNGAMPSTDDWSAPTDAYRSHVAGMLAEAKGQSLRARHCYRRAFQRYADLGFAHRAIVVALHITKWNKDPALLGYLRRYSRGLLADSWIVRQCAALGALEHDAVLARVTSAEREVLALLVAGCSTAEIAARRNRTVQTVRNTISRLNHAFGVDNRQALVRECVRRKLFSAD